MSDLPLDAELGETMDSLFMILKEAKDNKDTDDQLRLRIVAHNLRALAEVFLIAADHPQFEIHPTKVALGLLGTSDYILKHIPELDGELELPS